MNELETLFVEENTKNFDLETYFIKDKQEINETETETCVKNTRKALYNAILTKTTKESVDNKNYFNFVQLIIDRRDYYRITLEESKDGNTIINATCTDPDKFSEQEIERLKKENPEFDPLATASGFKLKKQEILQDDYQFIINKEGLITGSKHWQNIDLGDGRRQEIKTTTTYGEFNDMELDESMIETFINKEGDF